ncbi:DEAD/DEAH box helicase [Paraglaciecola mesophila]|uniref:ATP-dependent RNA helicase rhlE n=2 Tax=Paraglaciecola mesophila TaxID=197222 RepID=K6YPN9_9ALTE|nr:DEAD/DEAH box helicase [Paraglaciecola mesophila]GAC25941.1 ATP-dependent RNA helicase rhlE [Paraglaciecola mesophila KMM 241]
MQFSDLPLDHRLGKALEIKGFTEATEIQAQAIPYALMGKDLIASSKTGSGKTLAFLLPAVQRVLTKQPLSRKDPRVLILAPTRELAKQVFFQLKWLIAKHQLKAALILGGENFNDQVKALRHYPQFVVGTAGRIADHLAGKSLYLNGLEMLIMDEADRMLDLGFTEQLKQINAAADHRKRQSMMFSATLDNAALHYLTQSMLKAPHRISIGISSAEHKDIQQRFFLADNVTHKERLLAHMINEKDHRQVIVFTATRADTERLSSLLKEQGLYSIALSGDLSQGQRNNIMSEFGRGQQHILVTTDIASRGLDLLNVSLVVNFDLPKLADEYVHRVGRTGRAGNKGEAVSFVGPKDWASYLSIKSFLQQEVSFNEIEGLEAKFKGLRPPKKAKAPVKKAPGKAANNSKAGSGANNQGPDRVKPMQGTEVGDRPMKRKPRQVIQDDDNEE